MLYIHRSTFSPIRYVVVAGLTTLALSLTGCGEKSAPKKSGSAGSVRHEIQAAINGHVIDFGGMAMNNRFRNGSLELWNTQKPLAVKEPAAGEDAAQAARNLIGNVLGGNQLKINLVGVDLPNHKLPFRIAGTDEGVNALSSQRATLQLTYDAKTYMGGAVLLPDIPTDWVLTIERIEREVLHGTFRGTVVNMQDFSEQIRITDGTFALHVRGIAGEPQD